MTTRYCLLIGTFIVLISTAQAQIEMNSAGAVGIGRSPINTSTVRTTLAVEADTAKTHVYGIQTSAQGGTYSYGINSTATSTSGTYARAGIFTSGGAGSNTSIISSAYGTGSGLQRGLYIEAGAGETLYGLQTWIEGGTISYGIHSTAFDATTADYAGYFDGNVTVTGTFSNPSDRRLKDNILSLESENIISRLMQLNPTSFRYIDDSPSMHLPKGRQFGLIAQEVRQVFPELVSAQYHPAPASALVGANGEAFMYESVNYIGIIPILIQAIQDQQEQIETLQTRIATLEQNR